MLGAKVTYTHACAGHLPCCRLLLNEGADIEQRNVVSEMAQVAQTLKFFTEFMRSNFGLTFQLSQHFWLSKWFKMPST
jgi:hypothetical protein